MWCKGEIYDLFAMKECIQSFNNFSEEKYKHELKIQQHQEEIIKINTGKKTLKNFFKSTSSKQLDIENLRNTIETTKIILKNYTKIINILTVYLADIAIPEFKEDKIQVISLYK